MTDILEDELIDEKISEKYSNSYKNLDAVKNAPYAGCFYCEKIFPSSEVVGYTQEDDGSKTALCPYCDIDAVIPLEKNDEESAETLSILRKSVFAE